MAYQQEQQSTSLFRTLVEGQPMLVLHDRPPHVPFIMRDTAWNQDSRLQIDQASHTHPPSSRLHSEDAFPLWVLPEKRERDPFFFNALDHRRNVSFNQASSFFAKRTKRLDLISSIADRFTNNEHDMVRFTERFRDAPVLTITMPEDRIRNDRDHQMVKVAQALQNYHPEIASGLKKYIESNNYTPMGLEAKILAISDRLLVEERHLFKTQETSLYKGYIYPFEREFGSIDVETRLRNVGNIVKQLLVQLRTNPNISKSNAYVTLLLLPPHDESLSDYTEVESILTGIATHTRDLPDRDERQRLVNNKQNVIESVAREQMKDVLQEIREIQISLEDFSTQEVMDNILSAREKRIRIIRAIVPSRAHRGVTLPADAETKMMYLLREIPLRDFHPGYMEISGDDMYALRPIVQHIKDYFKKHVREGAQHMDLEGDMDEELTEARFTDFEQGIVDAYLKISNTQRNVVSLHTAGFTLAMYNHWAAMFVTKWAQEDPPYTVIIHETDAATLTTRAQAMRGVVDALKSVKGENSERYIEKFTDTVPNHYIYNFERKYIWEMAHGFKRDALITEHKQMTEEEKRAKQGNLARLYEALENGDKGLNKAMLYFILANDHAIPDVPDDVHAYLSNRGDWNSDEAAMLRQYHTDLYKGSVAYNKGESLKLMGLTEVQEKIVTTVPIGPPPNFNEDDLKSIDITEEEDESTAPLFEPLSPFTPEDEEQKFDLSGQPIDPPQPPQSEEVGASFGQVDDDVTDVEAAQNPELIKEIVMLSENISPDRLVPYFSRADEAPFFEPDVHTVLLNEFGIHTLNEAIETAQEEKAGGRLAGFMNAIKGTLEGKRKLKIYSAVIYYAINKNQ